MKNKEQELPRRKPEDVFTIRDSYHFGEDRKTSLRTDIDVTTYLISKSNRYMSKSFRKITEYTATSGTVLIGPYIPDFEDLAKRIVEYHKKHHSGNHIELISFSPLQVTIDTRHKLGNKVSPLNNKEMDDLTEEVLRELRKDN